MGVEPEVDALLRSRLPLSELAKWAFDPRDPSRYALAAVERIAGGGRDKEQAEAKALLDDMNRRSDAA